MYSVNVLWFFTIGVSSFGNPRIEAYLQLPAAYRSLSRPSSAPDAKAFTLCSCSLELPSFASIRQDTCALIARSVRFSFVLTWIAWVSLKHGFFFAAKRVFLLALFRFASLISQCWQNCLPFWLERPDLSIPFEIEIRLCPLYLFFHTQFFALFDFQWAWSSRFMNSNTYPYGCVIKFFLPFGSGWHKWTRTTDLALIRRAL